MGIQFCQANTTFLPLWRHGLSRCLFETIQPVIILVLSVVVFLYHHVQRRKCQKKMRQCAASQASQGTINNSAEDEALVSFAGSETVEEFCLKANHFKDFAFSSLPLPFLYCVQVLCHFGHVLLPVLHIIVKLSLCHTCVSGVDILTNLASLSAWAVGLSALKLERFIFFMRRRESHSLPLLLFWTVALVLELLAFVSWNSIEWWFTHRGSGIKTLELVTFCLRLCLSLLLFLLGFHGPGLYRSHYESEIQLGKKKKDASAKGSPWTDLWERSKKLWPFLWPKSNWLRLRVLVCVGILVAVRIVNVFVPIQNKQIVDYFSDPNNKENAWKLISVYIVLMCLQGGGGIGSFGLLNSWQSYLWVRVQQFTSRSVRLQLFEHLHNLSLRWHLQRKTGEVIGMVDRGSTSIESLLSYILFQIVPTIVDIIVAIIYFGLAFNGWFALIVFLTMCLYLVATIGITEWRTKYRRDMNAKDNATKAVAVDSLLNFETVKYYNNESFEVGRYNEKIKDFQAAEWLTTMTLNILNVVQNMIITFGLLAGMLYCGDLVVKGKLSVGDFVLFMSYMRQLYAPLNFLGTFYRLIQAAFIDMENMFDLLSEEVEIRNEEGAPALKLSRGLVEFKNVTFSYDERKPVLKGISFSVLPGQTVALVGPSGSGKSTIIRLLFRFYDVTSGAILIDGQDISKVEQKTLREVIGVVPQDTVLFNDTIKYNIRYGRVTALDKEVEDAAASADIHLRIRSFPESYETMVGERGLKLSGGEKQRVAIARTILKAPDVILLDEATSALDTQTERNIQASLSRVCVNKTSIVVAHRLSTIIGADLILVIQDGTIVERGRHHELLRKEGLYFHMWAQQLRAESGSAGEPAASESGAASDA